MIKVRRRTGKVPEGVASHDMETRSCKIRDKRWMDDKSAKVAKSCSYSKGREVI